MSTQHLVIGLDYGTSNSGAAYALISDTTDQHIDIEVVRRWPQQGRKRDATDKVPSDIAYDETTKQPIGYGLDIPESAQRLQWVKLLLEPEHFRGMQKSGKTERVWDTMKALDKLGKRPVDVVAGYLKWLWQRVVEKIIKDEDDDEIFQTAEVTVVLTLPAQWSDKAKDCMLRAAKMAGIDADGRTLKVRAEPEAAAAYELKARARKSKKHVKPGDCFIVVDAGGGTVDVTTYRIKNNDPLSIDQVVISKGDFCGSEFIDAEFQVQIKGILGSDWDTLDSQAKMQIADDFEYNIKRNYCPGQDRTYSIPVPGLVDDSIRGIQHGKMSISESVLQMSFEAIMTQVMLLIDDQRDDLEAKLAAKEFEGALKGVLLVGGFGGSEYLQARIEQEFPEQEGIKIWRGDQSWTAVVQGAVECEASHYRNVHMVNTRMSSFNYGIVYRQGNVRKVQWLVRKGQSMQSRTHTEPYGLRLDDAWFLDEDEYVWITVTLVRSATDNAPEDLDDAVQPHGDIECRIPTAIRYHPDSTVIQENPRAWHIPAELIMVMDSAVPSIKCRIQGRDYGDVKLSYFDEEQNRRSRQQSTASPDAPHPRSSVGSIPIDLGGSPRDSGVSGLAAGMSTLTPVDTAPPTEQTSSSPGKNSLKPTHSRTWSVFSPRVKREKSKEKVPKSEPKPRRPSPPRTKDGKRRVEEGGRIFEKPDEQPSFPGLF